MNITELQKTIYAIARAKGWHDPPLMIAGEIQTLTVLAKLALVHSELSEALAEQDAGRMVIWYAPSAPTKPEGFVVEIADVLIRVLDTCEALGLSLADCVVHEPSTGTTLVGLHRHVSHAVEALRVSDTASFVRACDALWLGCFELCERYGLDLTSAIYAKVEYNKTRPFRHGGKQA